MKLLVLSLAVALLANAAPAKVSERAACTTKSQRKAWHTLTRDEKLAYINAEKCLMTLPAKLGFEGPRTRFDEFQKLHVFATSAAHFVGAFLPWHRYLLHTHEYILKTECNYTGTQPYWQESLDAGNFTHSIVLDPETGFGGDGAGPNNCIKDGPFKDYVNAIGPGLSVTDHCIDRQISDCMSGMAAQNNVDQCMAMRNFSMLWPCIEDSPHKAGHGGIGDQMLNLWSSPGDPLFYLHHAYLDKLWWQWQANDLTPRLKDITGSNQPMSFEFIPGSPSNDSCQPLGILTPSAEVHKIDGDPGNVTTLGHVLTTFGMLPNVTIADVMDIQCGLLCYEYI